MAGSDKKCDVGTVDGLNVIKRPKENITAEMYVGEWSTVKIWPRSTSLSSLPLPATNIQY